MNAKKLKKFFRLLIIMAAFLLLPALEQAQTSFQQANFSSRCSNCWPGWIEIISPTNGVGPRVRNGAAYIFINGSSEDPTSNLEHLQFGSARQEVSEANVEFNFNNAAVGGRLPLTNGNFSCLTSVNINSYVTDELLVTTLRDTGDSWYGAFIGDYTLIDPGFVPDTATSNIYTTIGLLQKRESELEVLAVKAIPQVSRFSLIQSTFLLDESKPTTPTLVATFSFASGKRASIHSEIDPQAITSSGTAGIIYLVGNGSPCTNLAQREVAVRSFAMR